MAGYRRAWGFGFTFRVGFRVWGLRCCFGRLCRLQSEELGFWVWGLGS